MSLNATTVAFVSAYDAEPSLAMVHRLLILMVLLSKGC